MIVVGLLGCESGSFGETFLGGPLNVPIERVNPEGAILEVEHTVLHWA